MGRRLQTNVMEDTMVLASRLYINNMNCRSMTHLNGPSLIALAMEVLFNSQLDSFLPALLTVSNALGVIQFIGTVLILSVDVYYTTFYSPCQRDTTEPWLFDSDSDSDPDCQSSRPDLGHVRSIASDQEFV